MRYPENSFQKYAEWRVEDIFEDAMSQEQPKGDCDNCVFSSGGLYCNNPEANDARLKGGTTDGLLMNVARAAEHLCGRSARHFQPRTNVVPQTNIREEQRPPFNYAEAERQIREFTPSENILRQINYVRTQLQDALQRNDRIRIDDYQSQLALLQTEYDRLQPWGRTAAEVRFLQEQAEREMEARRQQWQEEIQRRINDEARRRQVSRQQVRNDYGYPPDSRPYTGEEILQMLGRAARNDLPMNPYWDFTVTTTTQAKPAQAKPVEDDPILKPSKRKFNL